MSALLALLNKKKQEMAASRRSRTAKLPDAGSRWRILGSWRGADQPFWHDFGQHYVKDAAGAMQAVYVCTEKTFGRPCVICDAVKQAIGGATDEGTMKLAGEAKSAARVLVNALQLDGKEPHKVEILELPPTVFELLIAICAEWEEAGETVLGASGKDIIINRTGTGKNTKYTAQVGAKTTAVPAGVCDKLHDLDEYVAQESTEAQTRALNSVRAIAGMLPAPSASGLPLAARGGMTIADDEVAVAPGKKAVFEDVPEIVDTPVRPSARPAVLAEDAVMSAPKRATATAPKAAPAAAEEAPWVAPAAAVAAGTGDPELDALLAELG